MKNIKDKLIEVGRGLIILSVLYGFGDYVSGGTTGHLSADLYLGKKQPTFLERFMAYKASNYFNIKPSKWMEVKK